MQFWENSKFLEILSYFDSQFGSLVEVVVLANGVLQSKHLDVGTQRRLAETVRVKVELIFHHRYEVLKKSLFNLIFERYILIQKRKFQAWTFERSDVIFSNSPYLFNLLRLFERLSIMTESPVRPCHFQFVPHALHLVQRHWRSLALLQSARLLLLFLFFKLRILESNLT